MPMSHDSLRHAYSQRFTTAPPHRKGTRPLIAEITLPIFVIVLILFLQPQDQKTDLGGTNKLVVGTAPIVLPLQGVEHGALILFACLPSAVFKFMLADRF